MSEPYLIAHLVRSEPAFDIASQMWCPECHAVGCPECDELGYWWVVGTSGHRAYPYWSIELSFLATWDIPSAPPGWPDHYPHSASPSTPKGALAAALSLALHPAAPPIKRRV